MQSRAVVVGRTEKGFESLAPFSAQMLRTSLPLGWEGAKVFVMATGPMPGSRRFAFSEGTVVGVHLHGNSAGHLHVNAGKGFRRVPFIAGQVALMAHRAEADNYWCEPFVIGQIILAPELLDTIIQQEMGADPVGWELRVHAAIKNDPLLWQLGLALDRELQTGNEWGRAYAESLIHTVAVHVLRHYSNRSVALPAATARMPAHLVTRVHEYVQARLGQDITLNEVAAQVGLSPYYFTRQFKLSTGQTLHDYIVEQRVEAARRLVVRAHLPLKEIATRVGFSDQSHLTRHFKRLLGVTPAALRAQTGPTPSTAEGGRDTA